MFHRRVTVLLVAWGGGARGVWGADPSDPAGLTTSTVAPAGALDDVGGDGEDDQGSAVDPAALDTELINGALDPRVSGRGWSALVC